jgi:hypothetical protein
MLADHVLFCMHVKIAQKFGCDQTQEDYIGSGSQAGVV